MTRCPHRRRDPKVAAHLLVPQGPARIFKQGKQARAGGTRGHGPWVESPSRVAWRASLRGRRPAHAGRLTGAPPPSRHRRVDSARGAPGREDESVGVHPRRGIPTPGGNRRPPGRGIADERRGLPQSRGHPLRDAKRTRAGASGAGTSRDSGNGARKHARSVEGVSCEDTDSDPAGRFNEGAAKTVMARVAPKSSKIARRRLSQNGHGDKRRCV